MIAQAVEQHRPIPVDHPVVRGTARRARVGVAGRGGPPRCLQCVGLDEPGTSVGGRAVEPVCRSCRSVEPAREPLLVGLAQDLRVVAGLGEIDRRQRAQGGDGHRG